MKLWYIKSHKNNWYDANWAHVIEAPSPKRVRQMAADKAADEGRDVWLDIKHSTVTMIGKSKFHKERIWITDCLGAADG